MGRRNSYSNVPRYSSDDRSSMGDTHVNDAIVMINKTQQRAVATMTHYQPNREDTLRMLFNDDDMAQLRRVKGLIKTDGMIRNYPVPSDPTMPSGLGVIKPEIMLNINFEGASVPAVEPAALHLYPDRIAPLLEFTAAVTAVHAQYEELKGVLRWFNRNATPGAVRYYFPQAMKLVPQAPIWRDLQEVPSRYAIPPNISVWTQAIKDAANTVAGMMLLPDDVQPWKRDCLWLTFRETGVHLDPLDPGVTHYTTDNTVYNL